jgi:hypothetical protein
MVRRKKNAPASEDVQHLATSVKVLSSDNLVSGISVIVERHLRCHLRVQTRSSRHWQCALHQTESRVWVEIASVTVLECRLANLKFTGLVGDCNHTGCEESVDLFSQILRRFRA